VRFPKTKSPGDSAEAQKENALQMFSASVILKLPRPDERECAYTI
jgi:hypothetical protein